MNLRDRIGLVSEWFEWGVSEFGSQEVGSHPFLDRPVYPVYLELVFQYQCQFPEVGHVLVYSSPRLLDSCVEHMPLPCDVFSWQQFFPGLSVVSFCHLGFQRRRDLETIHPTSDTM